MKNYSELLKSNNLKKIIKPWKPADIKINKNYKPAVNMTEKEILPKLDKSKFDEEDYDELSDNNENNNDNNINDSSEVCKKKIEDDKTIKNYKKRFDMSLDE